MEKVIPVSALVWLHIDDEGNVEKAELSGDVSWMKASGELQGFTVEGTSHDVPLSREESEAVLSTLVEDARWSHVELEFTI